MPRPQITRVHLIAGGFPPGTAAGHDMNYARLRLLGILEQKPAIYTTVSNDYGDLARWHGRLGSFGAGRDGVRVAGQVEFDGRLRYGPKTVEFDDLKVAGHGVQLAGFGL